MGKLNFKAIISFPGETFCHTLHIMDSKGTSVLVNKKCTTEKECQRSKVGCVEIDTQVVSVANKRIILRMEGYRLTRETAEINFVT